MGTAERRAAIMRALCRRRHDTVSNLAEEFEVSTRTILRDINALSASEPVYTVCGRYGGGVYVVDGYDMKKMYMTDQELQVLHKLARFAADKAVCDLKTEEYKLLRALISQYTKPKKGKEY